MKVSQKIFIKNREDKILTIRRSATDPSRALTWDMPGGELEEGETLIDGIKREVREEVGIDVQDISLIDAEASYHKSGVFWVQLGYVGRVDMPEITLSHEHDQYKWVTKEEFLELESSVALRKFGAKI